MGAMLEVDVQCRLGALNLQAQFGAGAGITALFGRSGAGKTSIVNAVSGLLPSCTGRVAIDGRILLDSDARIRVPAHRRRIGYVFQDGRLFPHLNVRSNLLFGRRFAPRRSRPAGHRSRMNRRVQAATGPPKTPTRSDLCRKVIARRG